MFSSVLTLPSCLNHSDQQLQSVDQIISTNFGTPQFVFEVGVCSTWIETQTHPCTPGALAVPAVPTKNNTILRPNRTNTEPSNSGPSCPEGLHNRNFGPWDLRKTDFVPRLPRRLDPDASDELVLPGSPRARTRQGVVYDIL